MEQLGNEKEWKTQTAITLLLRLVERGFLQTSKNGKEREYYPIISKDEYLKFETKSFVNLYHGNSLASFVSTFCADSGINANDAEELIKMVNEMEK